jgi:hypothetical protein
VLGAGCWVLRVHRYATTCIFVHDVTKMLCNFISRIAFAYGLLGGSVVWATAFRVDGTTADANRTSAAIQAHQQVLCDGHIPGAAMQIDGELHRVLGAAVMVLARKGGPSFWGHVSLRFLSCVGGRIQDTQYEYYRVGSRTLALFPDLFEDIKPAPDPAYLKRQRGRLVLRRGTPAADRGFIGQQLARNREIYAFWLKLSPAELGRMYRNNLERYQAQTDRLLNSVDLPDTYQGMGKNCTWHLRQDLPAVMPEPIGKKMTKRVFPMAILRDLEKVPVALAVVHVGSHGLRRLSARLGGVKALGSAWVASDGVVEVPRFRPIFRKARLSAELDRFHRTQMGVEATPAIVRYLVAQGNIQR